MRMIFALVSRYGQIAGEEPFHEQYSVLKYFYDIADELNILLFPIASNKNLDVVSDLCDGLIISGNYSDPDPKYYNQPLSDKTKLGLIDEYALDAQLIKNFSQHNKPILGICAGAQSINIYFGGDIIQHVEHHDHIEGGHGIAIKEDSFLSCVYGKDTIKINSFHHQAIKTAAPGFAVTAVSDDGVIEAIERGNIIGVQWHPEAMNDTVFFRTFVERFACEA